MKKIPLKWAVLIVVLGVGLVAGVIAELARPAPREALTTPSDFSGWVLGVDLDSRQIVVESQAQKIVRRVDLQVTGDTPIFRREGGKLRPISLIGVRLQDQAELWLTGPVPEEFPAQVNVRQVVVEKTP